MKIKILITAIILLMGSGFAFSQSISFTYDEAGNRLTRELEIKKINPNNNSDSGDEQKSSYASVETITINDVEVTISPNPNGGKFEVSIRNPGKQPNVKIYLHTMLGKQIYSSEQVQPITTINITNRKNGTYILTVIVNGTKENWKVIKQ